METFNKNFGLYHFWTLIHNYWGRAILSQIDGYCMSWITDMLRFMKPKNPSILDAAFQELGVREISGQGSNERILEYHKTTDLASSSDDVSWCSSFVNFVVQKSGYKGTRSALARSWLSWGKELDDPKVGCIVVLKRGREAWMGHVGIVTRFTDKTITVLGGNQGDAVSEQSFPRAQVLGYREPENLK